MNPLENVEDGEIAETSNSALAMPLAYQHSFDDSAQSSFDNNSSINETNRFGNDYQSSVWSGDPHDRRQHQQKTTYDQRSHGRSLLSVAF
jgi:hypothetical protein